GRLEKGGVEDLCLDLGVYLQGLTDLLRERFLAPIGTARPEFFEPALDLPVVCLEKPYRIFACRCRLAAITFRGGLFLLGSSHDALLTVVNQSVAINVVIAVEFPKGERRARVQSPRYRLGVFASDPRIARETYALQPQLGRRSTALVH